MASGRHWCVTLGLPLSSIWGLIGPLWSRAGAGAVRSACPTHACFAINSRPQRNEIPRYISIGQKLTAPFPPSIHGGWASWATGWRHTGQFDWWPSIHVVAHSRQNLCPHGTSATASAMASWQMGQLSSSASGAAPAAAAAAVSPAWSPWAAPASPPAGRSAKAVGGAGAGTAHTTCHRMP